MKKIKMDEKEDLDYLRRLINKFLEANKHGVHDPYAPNREEVYEYMNDVKVKHYG